MPLVKGKKAKSKKGFVRNLKQLLKDGYRKSQALAISYSLGRKKKKKKKKARKKS